jgi:hypothetical protein
MLQWIPYIFSKILFYIVRIIIIIINNNTNFILIKIISYYHFFYDLLINKLKDIFYKDLWSLSYLQTNQLKDIYDIDMDMFIELIMYYFIYKIIIKLIIIFFIKKIIVHIYKSKIFILLHDRITKPLIKFYYIKKIIEYIFKSKLLNKLFIFLLNITLKDIPISGVSFPKLYIGRDVNPSELPGLLTKLCENLGEAANNIRKQIANTNAYVTVRSITDNVNATGNTRVEYGRGCTVVVIANANSLPNDNVKKLVDFVSEGEEAIVKADFLKETEKSYQSELRRDENLIYLMQLQRGERIFEINKINYYRSLINISYYNNNNV